MVDPRNLLPAKKRLGKCGNAISTGKGGEDKRKVPVKPVVPEVKRKHQRRTAPFTPGYSSSVFIFFGTSNPSEDERVGLKGGG